MNTNMNMNNRNFVKGFFIMLFALVFGGVATTYPVGHLERSGPGMFPLIISSLLFIVGLISVIRSRVVAPEPLDYNVKNIVIVMASLVGFAVISHYVNMVFGIVFMVFCSTFAGTSYSLLRNVKISAGLVAVAFGFKYFLGLGLPLF